MKIFNIKFFLVGLSAMVITSRSSHAAEIAKDIALGARIAEFGIALPSFISTIQEGAFLINQTVTPLVPKAEALIKNFTQNAPDGLPSLLEHTISAYAQKNYNNLNFTKIGIVLENQIPELMSIILQLYPFIRFTTNRIGKPVLSFTYDVGSITRNAFIKNFASDSLEIINSGVIEETFGLLNNLDTLLAELLPRTTDLLIEIDRVLPQLAKLGVIK